jgi:hypothetical protein
VRSLTGLTRTIGAAALDRVRPRRDPLVLTRRRLPAATAEAAESTARAEVDAALAEVGAPEEVAGG